MKFRLSLAALLILPFSAHAQDNSAVQSETNQVLESSVVLDEATAVQGNTTLKIERLSTPDEELIRSLEENGAADNAASEGGVPDPQRQDKSFFVSAQTFDHTFTLINFWSLRGGIPTQASAWSNITSWKELSSSPSFVSGDTKYTMLILPSSAQVTDDSPALPTTLPSIVESGAFYQEVEGQSLSPEYLDFLDDLISFRPRPTTW